MMKHGTSENYNPIILIYLVNKLTKNILLILDFSIGDIIFSVVI